MPPPLEAQLIELKADLTTLVQRDADQEVISPALELMDRVLMEGRSRLPQRSRLAEDLRDLITPEMVAEGTSLRAADALVVIGQLLAEIRSFGTADEQTFRSLIALLPVRSDELDALRNLDFGNSFRWDDLDALQEFRRVWNEPDHRFHDPILDAARANAHVAITAFLSALGRSSGLEGDGWAAIVPADSRDTFAVDPDLAHHKAKVDEVNALATEASIAYQSLVETARHELGLGILD